MPIYITLANLIIPKKTIEKKYTGGIKKFRVRYGICQDNFNQEDDELFSLSTMNTDEYDIEELMEKGLHFDKTNRYSDDFVIIPRYGESLWKVSWIEDNGIHAWHKDCDSGLKEKARILSEKSMDWWIEQREKGNDYFGPFTKI